jgi:hypothetical protein
MIAGNVSSSLVRPAIATLRERAAEAGATSIRIEATVVNRGLSNILNRIGTYTRLVGEKYQDAFKIMVK